MSYYSNELAHYGILGQKWGVRRFQNEDGSLTAAGRNRYSQEQFKRDVKDYKKGKWDGDVDFDLDDDGPVSSRTDSKGNTHYLDKDGNEWRTEDHATNLRVSQWRNGKGEAVDEEYAQAVISAAQKSMKREQVARSVALGSVVVASVLYGSYRSRG